MSRLTIYLDEETERQLRAAANSQGLSVNRWAACLEEPRADQPYDSLREN